ncbi:hypothetical protein [Methylobacter sp. BlB1]|uniref:hypothetical protein n=1 Tax=Methylobacter sp. BlB1 TaxID=2785914 RepID=UPI001895E644|nr:hypothetical protein [Methylobacter sp. BlB1]MBF6649865.1 hypothetical protein [Methylobacter sp. BlB1]
MPNYFYKAVMDAHITGASLIRCERGPGIRHEGLDPKKRNSSGGATVFAAAQAGRVLSAADSTSFGQCLTGNQKYAECYATTDQHRLLRITLPDSMINIIVRNAASYDEYANMQAAVSDKECTAIQNIPPSYIEFLTASGSWEPIKNYPNPTPKCYGNDADTDEDW